jgi:hypothetical protein
MANCLKKKESDMSNDAEYKVGFCRPPKETRFKTGQSGNPAGRPKGIMDTHRLIDAIMNKKVVATIDGRTIKITKKQAAFLRLANDAATGDTPSMKLLMPEMFKIDEKKAAREAAKNQELTRTDREIIDAFLKGGDNG